MSSSPMKQFKKTVLIIALVSGLLAWWYKNLSPRQKQFYLNLFQQMPDLPARYQV